MATHEYITWQWTFAVKTNLLLEGRKNKHRWLFFSQITVDIFLEQVRKTKCQKLKQACRSSECFLGSLQNIHIDRKVNISKQLGMGRRI